MTDHAIDRLPGARGHDSQKPWMLYHVEPLLAGFAGFFGILPPPGGITTTTYHGVVQNMAPGAVPRIYNHSHTISADLHVPDGGAEGVIVAEASHLGGFSLFIQDGKLTHTYAFLGVFEYHQQSEGQLPTGDVNVQMIFRADEAKPATPGDATLLVNGETVGSGRLDHTVPFIFSGYAGMDVGLDNGLVVDRSYADKAPFAFTGTMKKVVFDVAPHLDDDEQAMHEHASQADIARGISGWEAANMSDDQKDVLIAAYLFEDLAKRDFDAVLKLAEDKTITVEGVVLVQKDIDGEVHVTETGDHLGRKGLKIGGGAGLVVGLFAPPLLAATAVGAAAGGVMAKFAKHRVESGIEEKMDDALPPGSGRRNRHLRLRAAPTRSTRRSSTPSRNPWRRSTASAPTSSKPDSPRRKPAWAAEPARDAPEGPAEAARDHE